MDVRRMDGFETIFSDEKHMQRYFKLANRTGDKADHSNQYMVACYLLSAFGSIYHRAYHYVDRIGINFPEMLDKEVFSSGELTYLRAALDLFGCVNTGMCLWKISDLSDDYFLYVMKGLFLARVHVM